MSWGGYSIFSAGSAPRSWLPRSPSASCGPNSSRSGTASLLAGLVCVLLYLASQWREIRGTFARAARALGALTLASVMIVLGILVAINYIAARQHKRWDLTATRPSGSRIRRQGAAEPQRAGKLKVFAKDHEFPRFRDRLEDYGYASSR